MTIPGLGDLAPPHRHAPIGRWLAVVLVLLLLAGGGYAAFSGLSGGSSSNPPTAAGTPCTHARVSGPAAAGSVHLVVLNATLRNGLAANVSTQLKQRGFHVSSIGNTPAIGTGVAKVRYGAGRLREAQAVADQINGAKLVRAARPGVELDIGPKFHALLSPAAARAARAALVASETRGGAPSPSATCSDQP